MNLDLHNGDNRQRIIHFASCTGHGGDALHILALAHGQRELGYDARILIGAADYSKLFVERAQRLDVPCEEVEELPLLDPPAGPAARAIQAPKLKRIAAFRSVVAPYHPDVIHLHTGGLAVRAAEVYGARLVPCKVRVGTIQWPFPWPEGSEKEQARWRGVARHLDHVICPSSIASRQQTDIGLPADKVSALPNATNVALMQQGDPGAIRRDLGIGERDPIVLFLARVEAQKRPLDAIGSFIRIAGDFPNARMLVAGTGDLEGECRRITEEAGLADRVHHLGYRTDVADLMQAADIYILPTAGESFGITLVEAMAAKCAVITSRIPPLYGEVVPEDCGLFADVGDVAGFARALRSLLADPALRERMACQGARIAQDKFSTVAVARKHMELYERLAAHTNHAAAKEGETKSNA